MAFIHLVGRTFECDLQTQNVFPKALGPICSRHCEVFWGNRHPDLVDALHDVGDVHTA